MERRALLALIALGAALYLSKLWQGDLRGDSLLYGEIAKEILKTGDVLTLHFAYKPWFNKPPFLFWLTAVMYKIFGVNTFSAKFWSSFMAFLCPIFLYLLSKEIFDERVAFLSSMVLLLTRDFIKDNVSFRFDSTITLSIIVILYLFQGRLSFKKGLIAGIVLGIALLTKGFVGFFGVAILLLYLILSGRPKDVFSSQFFLTLVLGTFIFSLWFFKMYMDFGRDFIDIFMGREVILRVTKGLGFSRGKLYYIKNLLETYWPWLVLLPPSLYYLYRKGNRDQKALVFSWIIFIAFTLVFPKPEYGRYLLPIYPAFSLSIGFFTSQLLKDNHIAFIKNCAFSLGVIFFFIANIFPIKLHKTSYKELRELKPYVDFHLNGGNLCIYKPSTRRLYQAVLFYFDIIPIRVDSKKDLGRCLLIIAEKRVEEEIKLPVVVSNKRYALFSTKVPGAGLEPARGQNPKGF